MNERFFEELVGFPNVLATIFTSWSWRTSKELGSRLRTLGHGNGTTRSSRRPETLRPVCPVIPNVSATICTSRSGERQETLVN